MKKIDIKKIDIKKIPKELLIAVGVSILLVVLFATLVYVPAHKRTRIMQKEAAATSGEIGRIREAMGAAKSVDEALRFMNEEITVIEKLFPRNEEVILRELSDMAKKMNMEVTSISPQKKRIVAKIDGVAVSVKGSLVKEMPVTMKLITRYKNVGNYTIALRSDFPMLVRVDAVNMSSGKEDGLLDVDLQLNSYMLSDTAE